MNAAIEPVDLSAFACRRCEGRIIGRNGLQTNKSGRFQRLICRKCQYIWVEYSLPIAGAKAVTPTSVKSISAAQNSAALNPAASNPAALNPIDSNSLGSSLPVPNPAGLADAARGLLPQGDAIAVDANKVDSNTSVAIEVDPSEVEMSREQPLETKKPSTEESLMNPAQFEMPNPTTVQNTTIQNSTHQNPMLQDSMQQNPSPPTTSMWPAQPVMSAMPFRRLELDMPTDWSPAGVLAYSQHAQQSLQQALAQFDHPAMAELELQGLEPRIKSYVRAKQAFETALMLQWAAVFSGPTAYPAMTSGVPFEPTSARPREASGASHESSTSSLGRRDQTPGGDSEDPEHPAALARFEHTVFQQELEAFKHKEKTWRDDRLMLKQDLILLELENQRLETKWSRVMNHYERLKSRLRNGETVDFVDAEESGLPSVKAMESPRIQPVLVTPAIPVPSTQKAIIQTSSLRIAPPKLSRSQRANIERLSSSLMANLVRLEGHRLRPRDLSHVIGERGPWKTVLEHLFGLGSIEREGEYITLSLVERLRRHLPASSAEPLANRRGK